MIKDASQKKSYFGYLGFVICFVGLVFLSSSCTYHAQKRSNLLQKTRERATETIAAASIAQDKASEAINSLQNLHSQAKISTNKVEYTKENFRRQSNSLYSTQRRLKISDKFLQRSQSLLGSSIQDQSKVVENLLSDNPLKKKWEQWEQSRRKSQEMEWVNKIRTHEDALIKYGKKYEKQRNERITWWSKFWGFIGTPIVVIIVLIVLFPALLPILTGLISKIAPRITSALGSVASSFAQNVGEGIDSLKKRIKEETKNEKEKQRLLKMIDDEVNKSLDKHDKKILKKYIKEK